MAETATTPRIKKVYLDKVLPALMQENGYKNKHQAPKFEKIIVSSCLKEAATDAKVMDKAFEELAAITGQKPKLTRSKKAIANFKLRENMPLGAVVTLRGNMMWEFFDRLTNVTLPRVRDFRGLSRKGFDGRGNYSMGVKEQIIFAEINYDKVDKTRGMNITFVTTAETNKEGEQLLEKLGFPFTKQTKQEN